MKSPVTALLWEQWRRTWYALPLTATIGVMMLYWIPSKARTVAPDQLGTFLDATLLLCAIACVMIQSEGGRRRGALADRSFVLPVPSWLLAAVPLVVCSAIMLSAGVAAYWIVVWGYGGLTYAPERLLLWSASAALAWSATLRARQTPLLRCLLAIIMLILFVAPPVQNLFEGPVVTVAASLGALTVSWLYSTAALRSDRCSSPAFEKRLRSVTARLRESLENFRPFRKIPSRTDAVCLAYELKAGNQLALPPLICALTLVLGVAGSGLGYAGVSVLRQLEAGDTAQQFWIAAVCLTTLGAALTAMTVFGPALVGSSNLIQTDSPEQRFLYLRPVSSRTIASAKLTSLSIQTLVWTASVGAVILFTAVWGNIVANGVDGGIHSLQTHFHDHGFLRTVRDSVYVGAVLSTTAWSYAGAFFTVILMSRPRIAYSLLGAAMAWGAAKGLTTLWIAYNPGMDTVGYLLSQLGGLGLLLLTFPPLIWAFWKRAADLRILALCTLLWGGVSLGLLMADPECRKGAATVAWLGIYAFPLAPVGWIPIAVAMGRHR